MLRFICAAKRRADPEGSLPVEKIVCFSEINSADTKYIEKLSDNLPLTWQTTISLPYAAGDWAVNIQNQYAAKLDLRFLTRQYKDGLVKMAKIITGEDESSVKKVVKNIEKSARF